MKYILAILSLALVGSMLSGCADNGPTQAEIDANTKELLEKSKDAPTYPPDPDMQIAPPAGAGAGGGSPIKKGTTPGKK